MPDFATLSNLAGEILVVVIFIWYLKHRDLQLRALVDDGHQAVHELSRSFHDLKQAILVQNELLRQSIQSDVFRRNEKPRRES